MDVGFTCDANWDSRINVALDILIDNEKFFESKDYGSGLDGIFICLLCRETYLNFKPKNRIAKVKGVLRTKKKLYMDSMYNLDDFRKMTDDERKQTVISQLRVEVPAILNKRSIPDFDRQRFITDFTGWLDTL